MRSHIKKILNIFHPLLTLSCEVYAFATLDTDASKLMVVRSGSQGQSCRYGRRKEMQMTRESTVESLYGANAETIGERERVRWGVKEEN